MRAGASSSASSSSGSNSSSQDEPFEPKVKGFDIIKGQPIFDKYVDLKFKPEDYERFPAERLSFRDDPRLQVSSLTVPEGPSELDWNETFNATVSILRLVDRVTDVFGEIIHERLDDKELMARFGIFPLEGKSLEKPLHNTGAVPREGAYHKMLHQVYWGALHVWLVHSKQYMIQENEALFGSAVCALITRRAFEWFWIVIRLWLMTEDVPAMNVTSELEHFMEFVFGLCAALDEAWKKEAPQGTAHALELKDEDLQEGQVGLLPCVKHVLWSNVYFGAVPHDHPQLHELTVYLVRQRMYMEMLPRSRFFAAKFSWADFPQPQRQCD